MTPDDPQERRTINLRLSAELVERLDALKADLGLRSRGAIVEQLLHHLLLADAPADAADEGGAAQAEEATEGTAAAGGAADGGAAREGCFDECGALVLVQTGLMAAADGAAGGEESASASEPPRPRGIDLPGFVRRQSEQLRRSLNTPRRASTGDTLEPLPQVAADVLALALERACSHWLDLYGKPPDDAVLDAALLWLAQDIWPQSDQSDGRPFSWSAVGETMALLAPAWPPGPASFERVLVVAGVLEDPFSTATLVARIPTLIRRFVHRFRRRRGTSFQTLEHTMTLHGALKLLQLPTTPGHRFTLPQIRDAYRQMALANHPDAGGSEDSMRRLNEAYQLLKELYRHPDS